MKVIFLTSTIYRMYMSLVSNRHKYAGGIKMPIPSGTFVPDTNVKNKGTKNNNCF